MAANLKCGFRRIYYVVHVCWILAFVVLLLAVPWEDAKQEREGALGAPLSHNKECMDSVVPTVGSLLASAAIKRSQ